LTVGAGVAYCAGNPKPELVLLRSEYREDDVLITLRVEKPPTRSLKSEVCAGVQLFVKRKIVLKRDLDEVEIFDGGIEPPLQRWPGD